MTEYVETFCPKPTPEGAVVIEVDEMWHYLGDKTNKLWIWTALDRATGRLIDWECGGRDQGTFEHLLARFRRWNARLLCTDEYVVYEQALSAGRHYAGKDQTVALERAHSRLRHWLARFRRRTRRFPIEGDGRPVDRLDRPHAYQPGSRAKLLSPTHGSGGWLSLIGNV